MVATLLLGGAFVYLLFPQEITPADVENVEICEVETKIIEKDNIVIRYKYRYQDFYDNNEPAKAYWTDKEGVEHEAGSPYTNKPTECARLHDKSLC